MSKITDIRTTIQTLITSAHPRSYFETAPINAVYPYVVCELPNSIDDGSLEQFVLDVDGWDKSKSSLAIEAVMTAVDANLHRKTVVVNGMSITIYRENRLSLVDDEPQIRRRKYIYQVRTF